MLAWAWISLCVAGAGEAAASLPDNAETVAVLRVTIDPAVTVDGPGADLMTARLAAELTELSSYRLLSAHELERLVEAESASQAAGCGADTACVAELAGAAGARLALVSRVMRAENRLLWTATLADSADGSARGRATVNGGTVVELVGQSRELVLGLLGRADEAALEGPRAQQELGLASAGDLEAFRDFRRRNLHLGASDAFTRFLALRNREAQWLAILEVVLLSTPALLALPTALAASWLTNDLVYSNSALSAGALAHAVVLGTLLPAACGALTLGLVLLAVDALDVGEVKVSPRGCCRKDEDLWDTQEADRARLRAWAVVPMIAALLAPAACGAGCLSAMLAPIPNSGPVLINRESLPLVVSVALFPLQLAGLLAAFWFGCVTCALAPVPLLAGVLMFARPADALVPGEFEATREEAR